MWLIPLSAEQSAQTQQGPVADICRYHKLLVFPEGKTGRLRRSSSIAPQFFIGYNSALGECTSLCLSLQGWGARLDKSSCVYYKIDLSFYQETPQQFFFWFFFCVVTQISRSPSFETMGNAPNGAEKQVICRCCTRWHCSEPTSPSLCITHFN